jgi:hypothetical protein
LLHWLPDRLDQQRILRSLMTLQQRGDVRSFEHSARGVARPEEAKHSDRAQPGDLWAILPQGDARLAYKVSRHLTKAA